MKIVTHNGRFHTDDLMAVAALLLKYPDAEVVRSRDEKVIKSADIVVDVGQIHDPNKNRFDHHQKAGAGRHVLSDIPYASFGLVWEKFGEDIAGGKEEAKIIESMIVTPIDAIDNGVNVSVPSVDGIREYSVGDYFRSFADQAETLEEYDESFKKALPHAVDLLKREINSAKRSVADWTEVRRIFNESENKRIIILPKDFDWQPVLVPTEAQFVIYPRVGGTWGAKAVRKRANSFEVKKPFPTSWAGLRNEMLASVSGVEDAMFCHHDAYLCGAKTQEGAIALAQKALENRPNF